MSSLPRGQPLDVQPTERGPSGPKELVKGNNEKAILRQREHLHRGFVATKARFSDAGTYVVRAVADDGSYTTPVDITVTVKAAQSSQVAPR